MDTKNKPFNIRVLQAKNEMFQAFHGIGIKYDLPGVVLDLIVSELLSDERQAHLSLMSEQFDQVEEEKNADTRTE